MFNTLYRKLSLTLFLIVTLVGILFFLMIRFTAEMYQQEVAQKLNDELASHIVAEELLLEDGEINSAALKHIFHMMMVINPSIELYLLDKSGEILSFSAPQGKVKREQVDVLPIKSFISGGEHYPLLGDDPRNQDRKKVFSAAAIPQNGPVEGYIYIILGGELFDNVVDMLEESYILRLSLWGMGAAMLVALIAGMVIFSMLTGRLQRLSLVMDDFASNTNNKSEKVRYSVDDSANDEVELLGIHFNQMADKIDMQLLELEKMDSLRREMVANVSHDLRTPIAAMQGYLETLLLKGEDLSGEERKEYMTIAMAQSKRLSSLVEELFELAKLDSIEGIVYAEPFSLAELIQDIVQGFQLHASNKEISLKTKLAGQSTPMVYGDISMMHRALENLIENAIRHTQQGGAVSVGLTPCDGKVLVMVSDNGCGIPNEQLPNVFERFYQVDESRKNAGSNAGLGLAITKRILDLHGSTISVDSSEDHGTTFSFDMPVWHS